MVLRWTIALLCIIVLRSSSAQQQDYSIHNPSWNGLQTVAALAHGLGYSVQTPTELDWGKLHARDVVFIFYPSHPVDPHQLFSFVQRGGRILLADDFGGTDQTLATLGFVREPVKYPQQPVHNEIAFTPIAYPLVSHPLTEGIDHLITNHPAALSVTEGALRVFGFRNGQALVAAGGVGTGKLVVLSDPSLLINRMVQFDGNFLFALNTLRYLGPTVPQNLLIFVGQFPSRPADLPLSTQGEQSLASTIVEEVNQLLAAFNTYVPHMEILPLVALCLATLVVVCLLLLLPFPQKPTNLWAQFFSSIPTPKSNPPPSN